MERPAVNRAVVWVGPGKTEVRDTPYPTMTRPWDGKPLPHAVILKVVLSAICGSDLHMVRGRTNALPGLQLGHEITGTIFEMGPDVENFQIGDLVSVPFNVCCGRCKTCKKGMSSACLNVNYMQPGGAYGYVNMGDWRGGQSEYVMVPYADYALLKLPPLEQCRDKIIDLALLTDVFPTGYNGAVGANVTGGSYVFITGAGPVGLAAAQSSFLLGAAVVVIGDSNVERLKLAEKMGCKTIDITKGNLIDQLYEQTGKKSVDCGIECVGYEAHSCDKAQESVPESALNAIFELIAVGGSVSVPGVYLPMDPMAKGKEQKMGYLPLMWGAAWQKAIKIAGVGQCPIIPYQYPLYEAIMAGRTSLASALNCRVISLDEAPEAYKQFEQGVPHKFLIDPFNTLGLRTEKKAESG